MPEASTQCACGWKFPEIDVIVGGLGPTPVNIRVEAAITCPVCGLVYAKPIKGIVDSSGVLPPGWAAMTPKAN